MTDEEIIEKVKKGDIEVYSYLVQKYKNVIFGLIYKYTNDYNETQDLAQEVFIKMYKQINNFKFQSKLSTWLYRIATNICIDWDRRRNKNVKILHLDEVITIDNTIDLEDKIIFKEQQEKVRAIVGSLEDKYKLLIVMYHFHNLKYKEISDILQIPQRTVETRLYRARALIKKQFKIVYDRGET